MRSFTQAEWWAEAEKLFGKGTKGKDWVFECVRCNTRQCGQDFIDLGLTAEKAESVAGFSCIGRFTDTKGCDWTLGGLFQIHNVTVVTPDGKSHPIFPFADLSKPVDTSYTDERNKNIQQTKAWRVEWPKGNLEYYSNEFSCFTIFSGIERGKVRYSYYSDLSDYVSGLNLQDIRVTRAPQYDDFAKENYKDKQRWGRIGGWSSEDGGSGCVPEQHVGAA